MKKIISLALTLSMLACMAISTFAVGPTSIVGARTTNNPNTSQTHLGTVADGVDASNFGTGTSGANVDIKVTTGEVQHRYAVDITYDEMTFAISGSSMVWNVNTLKYESLSDQDGLGDKKFNVAVTNYSDLPVYLTATTADKDANDFIGVGVYKDETETVLTGEVEIAAATSVVPYAAQTYNFDVCLKASGGTWDDASNYYLPKLGTGAGQQETITVATFSVTIAKDATPATT